MLQTLRELPIQSVAVIDDEPDVRSSYAEFLEDLDLRPVPEDGPLEPLERFVEESSWRSDAAICDYRMKVSDYAPFDGAELVARYYRAKFPALLCTRFEEDIDEIRSYRKNIPVLLSWEDIMDPDTIFLGFERVLSELRGDTPASRRPWRTLVHVHDVDHDRGLVHVLLPGWDSRQGIRLRTKDFPAEVRIQLQDDFWLHAHVNIGAEKREDLFFEKWEID